MLECQTLPRLLRRNNVIRSEAARERAELGRQFYEHKQCGRKKMGNTVYIGSHSLLKKAYMNCTCYYEASPLPSSHSAAWKLSSGTCPSALSQLPLSDDIMQHSVRLELPCKFATEDPEMREPQRELKVLCVAQCVSSCQERQCELNKVVTKGITAPLEVFYTGGSSVKTRFAFQCPCKSLVRSRSLCFLRLLR